jgi:hypothetical protein
MLGEEFSTTYEPMKQFVNIIVVLLVDSAIWKVGYDIEVDK